MLEMWLEELDRLDELVILEDPRLEELTRLELRLEELTKLRLEELARLELRLDELLVLTMELWIEDWLDIAILDDKLDELTAKELVADEIELTD
jgi:hypothetical protein